MKIKSYVNERKLFGDKLIWVTVLAFAILATSLAIANLKKNIYIGKPRSISVIIPVHNSEKTIDKCIKSVLNTKHENLEIIVVNDGSTDNTLKEVQKFKKNHVKIISQKHLGKAAALNNAFKYTKNEIIFILDSDTFVDNECFEHISRSFDENTGIVKSKISVENQENLLTKLQQIWYVVYLMYSKVEDYFKTVLFGYGCGIAIRRDTWVDVGGFQNVTSEDRDFIIRCIKNGWEIKYCPNFTVKTIVPTKIKDLFLQRAKWAKGSLECFFNHPMFYLKKIHIIAMILPQYVLAIILFIFNLILAPSFQLPVSAEENIFYYEINSSKLVQVNNFYNLALNSAVILILWVSLLFLIFRIEKEKLQILKAILYLILYLPLDALARITGYAWAIKDILFKPHL